ncbi:MAG: hypothetical protein Kow0042_24350 [Calditrichia bacterium]
MSKKEPIVTLLTDFGSEDGYVGAMKGVLCSGRVQPRIIDISHEIEPYNIRQAAFCLLNYASYFPAGTVHLVVVDPGVGTEREGLVLQTPEYYFIGPNNGVFSFIYQSTKYQAFKINEAVFEADISPTFHGRDVFAPVALKILEGEEIRKFTRPIEKLVSIYEPWQKTDSGDIRLKVIHVDHFGNLILNFTHKDWQQVVGSDSLTLHLPRGTISGLKKTFGQVAPGEVLALWDSSGFLQIAQNRGNAARHLNLTVGDTVLLKFE